MIKNRFETLDEVMKIEHDLRDMHEKCYTCGRKTDNYFIIPVCRVSGKRYIKICTDCYEKAEGVKKE